MVHDVLSVVEFDVVEVDSELYCIVLLVLDSDVKWALSEVRYPIEI